MRLTPRTYDRVLKVLPELYAVRSTDQFAQDIVQILDPLLPSDGCGWFVHRLDTRRVAMCVESTPCLDSAMLPRMAAWAPRHPFISLWARQTTPTTVLFSDVDLKTRRRHLDEYHDIFRVIGRDHLTSPIGVSPVEATALSYRRDRRPFSEDHRNIADLLQPHLAQAWRNAKVFSAFSRLSPTIPETAEPLTGRESSVAFWLAQGKTNREIAVILKMSPRTAEKHVERILRKLGVENRVTAALMLAATYQNK